MHIFKTNRKYFWENELKSWLMTIGLTALLCFGLAYFSILKNDNTILFVIIVTLLSKLAETLKQYHIKEIQIDNQNKQLRIKLHSVISGEKIKRYELAQVNSELIENTGLKRYIYSPFTLKIHLNPKETFRISNRFGFTLNSLTSVNRALNMMNNP